MNYNLPTILMQWVENRDSTSLSGTQYHCEIVLRGTICPTNPSLKMCYLLVPKSTRLTGCLSTKFCSSRKSHVHSSWANTVCRENTNNLTPSPGASEGLDNTFITTPTLWDNILKGGPGNWFLFPNSSVLPISRHISKDSISKGVVWHLILQNRSVCLSVVHALRLRFSC